MCRMRSVYFGSIAALWLTEALKISPTGEQSITARISGRRHLLKLSNRHHNATSNFAELELRQANGQCGAQHGRCPGDLCCSSYGFCGDSIDHCHPLFDCQVRYGTCGWPRAAPQPTTTSTASTTSTRQTTTITSTTIRPPSTSPTSVIPTTTSTSRSSTSPTSSVPIPTGSFQVTTNGMCGNNTMCIGNPNFGPCCSQFFWCGSSMEFCGAGCRSEFGACFGVPGLPENPPTNATITSPGGTSPSTTSPGTPPTTTTTPSTTRITTTSTTSTFALPAVPIPPGLRSSTDGRCGNGVT
ncbi:hypothetical protein VTI74DRAFT_11305 [Chaetomium olivicolor]